MGLDIILLHFEFNQIVQEFNVKSNKLIELQAWLFVGLSLTGYCCNDIKEQ